jgi:hypothetical protein
MIFSQWQPDGGYKYFESSRRLPIGDDVPGVELPEPSGGIGVPAQDAGYPLPSDATFIGEGDEPKGIMAPMARDGFLGLGSVKSQLSTQDKVVVLFVIGVLAAAVWAGRR